jgi:hypothetical protein
LDPVVGHPPLHELEVVHDDEAQIVLGLQPARLRAKLHDRDAGGIVDEDGEVVEAPHRAGDAREIVFLEVAGTQLVGVDAGFGAEQALDELLAAHLEGEDANRDAALLRRVRRDVERERRLSHTRAGREHDQVRALEPAGELVEFAESGGHTKRLAAVQVDVFDLIEVVGEHLRDGDEVLGAAALGQREQDLLGPVDGELGVVLVVVGHAGDLAGRGDQAAQDGAAFDDAAVVLDVDGGGDGVDQRGDVGGAPDLLEPAAALQFVADEDEVGGLAPLEQVAGDLVDGAVRLAVEILGP